MKSRALICLYGSSGSGKTRLLLALEEFLSNEDVLRIGAEGMIQEMIESLRFKGMAAYRQKYLELDNLLVDNLRVLEKKPMAASEICQVLQERAKTGRLTVIASDLLQEDWVGRNTKIGEFLAEGVSVRLTDIKSTTLVQTAKRQTP